MKRGLELKGSIMLPLDESFNFHVSLLMMCLRKQKLSTRKAPQITERFWKSPVKIVKQHVDIFADNYWCNFFTFFIN